MFDKTKCLCASNKKYITQKSIAKPQPKSMSRYLFSPFDTKCIKPNTKQLQGFTQSWALPPESF